MRKAVFQFSLVLLVLIGCKPPETEKPRAPEASKPAEQPQAEKSLFDRLDGTYPIGVVCDDFIDRVLVNDTLNANPEVDAARKRVPKAGLKFQVAALVCELTGGPYKYHGRNMKDSHAHLGINQKEWDAMVTDFKATLAKFKVPEKEQRELLEIMGKAHDDVVTK